MSPQHRLCKPNTYRKEVPHNPLKHRSQKQQHRPNEEEDTSHATQARGSAPSHHHHCEAESRDDEAHKAHGRRVGEALVRIADMWDFRGEVELFEELWGDREVGRDLVEGGEAGFDWV